MRRVEAGGRGASGTAKWRVVIARRHSDAFLISFQNLNYAEDLVQKLPGVRMQLQHWRPPKILISWRQKLCKAHLFCRRVFCLSFRPPIVLRRTMCENLIISCLLAASAPVSGLTNHENSFPRPGTRCTWWKCEGKAEKWKAGSALPCAGWPKQ